MSILIVCGKQKYFFSPSLELNDRKTQGLSTPREKNKGMINLNMFLRFKKYFLLNKTKKPNIIKENKQKIRLEEPIKVRESEEKR